jgi:elongation factor G
VVQHNDLIPAFLGSAEHVNGLHRLMKSLRHECPGVEETLRRLTVRGDAVAVGCLGDQVKHLGKTIVVRALNGPVGNGHPVGGAALGSLTALAGAVPLEPGSLGLAAKSDHLTLGSYYTADGSTPLPGWALPRAASFRRIVTPVHEKDDVRLSSALERMAEIDPALGVEQHAESGHALLNLQGPLHLRRVKEVLKTGFGIDVEEETVPPALRETITRKVSHHHRHRKQSGGAGQFADVQIDLSPGMRGSGFDFSDVVKGGAVPKNYIPSVEAGAVDALTQGPNGHPVVDVAVVLKDGKHHSVDSSDYAFRMAGKQAVKEAMAEAGAVLLQPIVRVQIHVPSDYTGGLVPVVSGMKGQVLGFDSHPDAAGWDVFDALLPAAVQDDLCSALASSTRGTGWFTTVFDHYQEARAQDFAPA